MRRAMPARCPVRNGNADKSVGHKWHTHVGTVVDETIELDTNFCRNSMPTASLRDKSNQHMFEIEQQASTYDPREATAKDDAAWAFRPGSPVMSSGDKDAQQRTSTNKEVIRGSGDRVGRKKGYCRKCKCWFGNSCPEGASCCNLHIKFRQRECNASALCHSRFTVAYQSEAAHVDEKQVLSATMRKRAGQPSSGGDRSAMHHARADSHPRKDLGWASERSLLSEKNNRHVTPHQCFNLGDSQQKEHAADQPVLGVEGKTSHEKGQCKPCIFWFYSCCDRGAECKYCHIKHTARKYKQVASRLSKLTSERLFNALELQHMLEHRPASAKLVFSF